MTYLLLMSIAFSHSIASILLGLLLLILVFVSVRDKSLPPMPAYIGLFLAFVLWLIVTSLAHGLDLKEIGKMFYYTPLLLVPILRPTHKHIERIIIALCSLYAIIILIGLIQRSTGIQMPGPYQAFRGERFLGFTGHPIFIACTYTFSALLALGLITFGSIKKDSATLLTVLCLILATGLLFTQTRSFYLGMGGAILVLLIVSKSRKLLCSVIAVAMAFGMFVLINRGFTDRVASMVDTQSNISNLGRIEMWKVGLRVIGENWSNAVFGIGYGGWKAHSEEYFRLYNPWAIEHSHHLHIHNIALQTWLEAGLLGLGIYASFLISLFRELVSALKSLAQGTNEYALAFGVILCFISFMIAGLFDYLHQPGELMLFYMLIALALSTRAQPISGKPA